MNYVPYPYMPDMSMSMNYQENNPYKDLEGRISRLEREVRRLEQKISKFEHKEMKPLTSTPNNPMNDNSGMYMV